MPRERVCLDCGVTEGQGLWHFCRPCQEARMKRDGEAWWRNIIRDIKAAGLPCSFSDRVPEKKTRAKKEDKAEGTHQAENETLPLFEDMT